VEGFDGSRDLRQWPRGRRVEDLRLRDLVVRTHPTRSRRNWFMVNSRSNQKNHVLRPLRSIRLHESYRHIRRLCIPDLLVLQSQANMRGRTTSFQSDARPFRVSLQRGQQTRVHSERRAKLDGVYAVYLLSAYPQS